MIRVKVAVKMYDDKVAQFQFALSIFIDKHSKSMILFR